MATAFLSLGSNMGDRAGNLREALGKLSEIAEVRVLSVSSFYDTSPVGFHDQAEFVNAVAQIETSLSPLDLLHTVLDIENSMGRIRNFRWGPRVIDIDILLYDAVSADTPELTLPHPRMMERAFVLAPLAEIAPDLVLPNGETAAHALERVRDQHVQKLEEVA